MSRSRKSLSSGCPSIEIVSIDAVSLLNGASSSQKISFNVLAEVEGRKGRVRYEFSGELRDTGWAGLLSLQEEGVRPAVYTRPELSSSTQALVQQLIASVYACMARGSLAANTNAPLGGRSSSDLEF